MLFDVSTWYLSAVPVLLAYVISFAANAKLDAVRKELGSAVRTRRDLGAVREAINFNKILGWTYLALWAGQIVALVLAVKAGLTPFRGAVGHVFIFGVATLPGGLWSKSVENRFKAMTVEGSDPDLKSAFQRYLVDWNKPSLSVPE
jgi:hypothetical protein